MRAQVTAMTLGGHETTANTLSWMLWELAKHPQIQEELRQEIAGKRKSTTESGAYELTLEDLESLPVLQAVIKVLRRRG